VAGRTIFNLRVHRCPSCTATLAVEPGATLVVCEYCDAHVQIARSKSEPPPKPEPTYVPDPEHPLVVSEPKVSAFGWVVFSLVLTLGLGGGIFALVAHQLERAGVTDLLAMVTKQAKPLITSGQIEGTAIPATTPDPPAKKKTKRSSKSKRKKKASKPSTAAEGAKPEKAPKTKSKKVIRKPKLPEPTGPVLSVSDAEAALKPKVLTCMRELGVHDIMAYMGNSKVGAVSVLARSGSRVDGVRASIKGTALGKCMDRAGATLRSRAFKSNYLRFQLVNDAVPDPLGDLPAKADRAEFERIIATADPKILECAKKHGEEGAKEVFYFVIDGPSGKPRRVDASYRSKGFKRCAEPIYKKLSFPKVRQWDVKITKHLQM
jgi:hypothetical protein